MRKSERMTNERNLKTLRKLLDINEQFSRKQSKEIDSLKNQLKITIKERNDYKDKFEKLKNWESDYKKLKKETVELARAFAEKEGVLR